MGVLSSCQHPQKDSPQSLGKPTIESKADREFRLRWQKFEQNKVYYARILEKDPDNILILNRMGDLCNKFDLRQAKPYFEKVLSLNKNDVHALNELGWIYFYSGTRSQAKSYLERAVATNPNHPDAFYSLGNIYLWFDHWLGRRDLKRAEFYFQKALSLEPKSVRALRNLGYISYYQGKWNQAQRYLEHALSLDKNDILTLEALGKVFYKKKNFDQSEIYFKKVLVLEPHYAVATKWLQGIEKKRKALKKKSRT